MISVDESPPLDLSSSHHHHQEQDQQQQQLSHDHLKISDIDLKSPDADLDDIINQLPSFSIRDHVFGLRNKDVACNWPFSSTSLQFCLKHEVKNLLPPFQSLDSLRKNSSLTKSSDLETRLTDEKLVKASDHGKPTNNQLFESNEKPFSKSLITNPSVSKSQKSKQNPPSSSQKTENASIHIKKTRFEEINPNNLIISETMASKVCPVCKIFASSSNTKLNAHIDQCLTGEGTMKWTEISKVIVKHKVKPRKMRLMVDIYKTAPHCTVEELDKRNGTSWANNSSFPAQEFRFQNEEKEDKEEPKKNTINSDEGDVYIDTDGTKVRILSVPKTGLFDNHGAQKLVKKKKNIFKIKHPKKYSEVNSNSDGLCSRKTRARSGYGEDERGCEIMEKFGGKNRKMEKFHGKNRMVEHETKDLLVESDKSSSKCDLGIRRSSSNNAISSRNKKKMRTSSSIIKHSFHKGTRTHDDDDVDDDDDEDDDVDDDDDETRSKSSKFPSLSKNLSFPAAKINLKRKFTAVKKLSRKLVEGPSQDSSKEQSRTEEQTTNSKTTTESNEESFVRIQNESESFRNETLLSNIEQVFVDPSPSFMGLCTSFNPKFSKQECIELYQDQICSTNDVQEHENYFPIPIPGPPGSFLPESPGGEPVSEEQIQEIRVLPSENPHNLDPTDQDSPSNSPNSTVSNPSLARSDSRSTSIQEDTYKKAFFNDNTGFTEMGFSLNSFKNDQPCCCARKEVALNYQDSYILTKQPIQTNKPSIPSGMNFRSGTPVLRLMGKNLTVVKTDEHEYTPPQSSQQQHPQRPVMFNQYENGLESRPVYGGFMAPMDRYRHGGLYQGPYGPQAGFHHDHHDHNGLNFLNGDQPQSEGEYLLKRNHAHTNPLYSMYSSYSGGGGGGGGSSVFRGGGFQTFLGNEDLGTWNIGSSSSSPSMSHLGSSRS